MGSAFSSTAETPSAATPTAAPATPLNPALQRLKKQSGAAPKALTPRTKTELHEALSCALREGAQLDEVVASIKASGVMATKRVGIVGGDVAAVDAFYNAFANLGDMENSGPQRVGTPIKKALATTPSVVTAKDGRNVRVEVTNLSKATVGASAANGFDAFIVVCGKSAAASKIVRYVPQPKCVCCCVPPTLTTRVDVPPTLPPARPCAASGWRSLRPSAAKRASRWSRLPRRLRTRLRRRTMRSSATTRAFTA